MRLLAVAGMLAAAAPSLVAQQPSDRSARPQILVTGQGEARTTPDRGVITLGVQSRAPTASAAAAENARKQRAVLDTLRALGFTQEQLRTANYSVFPEMRHNEREQRPELIGYVVSNVVRVDLRRVEQASTVIDAALAKGANEVHGLSFYVANADSARRMAITDAVRRARADAEALAAAAGGSLGPIVEVSTLPPISNEPIMYRAAAAMDARGGMESTPIEGGQETIRVTVHIRWEFLPRQ